MVEVMTRLYEELAQSYIAQPFTTFFGAVCITNAFSKNRGKFLSLNDAGEYQYQQYDAGNDAVVAE